MGGFRASTGQTRRVPIDDEHLPPPMTTEHAEVERCRVCGHPADVEVWDDYWLCKTCRDRLGRDALSDPESEP
jgi:hypothetical protein